MRNFTLCFIVILLHPFPTEASGEKFWECPQLTENKNDEKIQSYYTKVQNDPTYNKVKKLWKAINCKYPKPDSNNSKKIRKLIVFLDGTWNEGEEHGSGGTNIWRLYNLALERAKTGDPIIPYYDKGVGSHDYDQVLGGLYGKGNAKNIRQAYRFLVEAYKPNDEIYIFGFSRGAFTARSLNGMIEHIGLLNKGSINKKYIEQMGFWKRSEYFFTTLVSRHNAPRALKQIWKKLSGKNTKQFIYEVALIDLVNDLYDKYQIVPNPPEDIRETIKKGKEEVVKKYKGAEYKKYYNDIIAPEKTVEVIGVFDTVPCIGTDCKLDHEKHRTKLYAKKGYHVVSIDEEREKFTPLLFDGAEEVYFSGAHSDDGGGYNSDYLKEGIVSCDIKKICNPNFDYKDIDNYYTGLETIPLNWMINKVDDKNIFPEDTTFAECPIGKIHNEFYKKKYTKKFGELIVQTYVGNMPREISEEALIHSSVSDRWKSDCLLKQPDKYNEYQSEKTGKYRPDNLIKLKEFSLNQ